MTANDAYAMFVLWLLVVIGTMFGAGAKHRSISLWGAVATLAPVIALALVLLLPRPAPR